MHDPDAVKARYFAALDELTARLEEDYYVLAVALYGSLARGEPWEKSDIDLFIVVRDGRESRAKPHVWLTVDGINTFAQVFPRSRLRQAMEGALQGSVLHSVRSQCKLLFSKDPSIEAWFTESSRVGERDQGMALLSAVAMVPYYLEKAQKWFHAKHDLAYSSLWTLFAVNALARVEAVLNGEAPGREALDQALAFNPDFFTTVYLDLVHGPKTETTIQRALDLVDGYLVERADRLFQPVLDYLAEADGPCTATELAAYFNKKVPHTELGGVYDWLAQHGVIDRLSSPVRLTRKSSVTLDEPAYYYDSDDVTDWE